MLQLRIKNNYDDVISLSHQQPNIANYKFLSRKLRVSQHRQSFLNLKG